MYFITMLSLKKQHLYIYVCVRMCMHAHTYTQRVLIFSIENVIGKFIYGENVKEV
jgi:hypothetical protein